MRDMQPQTCGEADLSLAGMRARRDGRTRRALYDIQALSIGFLSRSLDDVLYRHVGRGG